MAPDGAVRQVLRFTIGDVSTMMLPIISLCLDLSILARAKYKGSRTMMKRDEFRASVASKYWEQILAYRGS